MTIERIGKLRAGLALCVAVFGVALGTAAQAPIISLSPGDTINTVAGTGVKGFSGDEIGRASCRERVFKDV